MTSDVRQISVAFVVGKLLIDGKDHLLLRRDPKWNDFTFVGGHESEVDEGDLARTVIRETEEEVPGLHEPYDFSISPLTETIKHGPVWSRSIHAETVYTVRFYHLQLKRLPKNIRQVLLADGINVLTPIEKLFSAEWRTPVSRFVHLLDKQFPGGLRSIPYSWSDDLSQSG
jgi:hypothetical protein